MCKPQGDERVADMIETYRDTIHPLYQFVSRRAGRSRQLAEDITQETYLRAVVQWNNGRRPENALAWLQTVARNLLLNHYRRRSPESLKTPSAERVLETEPVVDPDAAAMVYWGLAHMGRRPRRLLEAFYIEGQPTRTIAIDLGVSQRAVEGRLRRARQALKIRLTHLMNKDGTSS